jgi:anti-sigma factor RsiW
LNTVTDEEIGAYVDGHFDERSRYTFETKLANDPELSGRVSAQRWLSRQIAAAFDSPPGDEIDPAELVRLGLADSNVVAMTDELRRKNRRSAFAAILTGAIAASLVGGVMIDRAMLRPGNEFLQTDQSGQILAKGKLADSLSHNLSGQTGLVRIGLTFHAERTVCRTFSTQLGLSGIGCRASGRWIVPIVTTSPPETQQNTEYHLAGGEVAPPVMADVDRRMVGEPLTIEQERSLIAARWKSGN